MFSNFYKNTKNVFFYIYGSMAEIGTNLHGLRWVQLNRYV